jgi:hypothetical protein
MVPMTTNEPERRHGQISRPNQPGADANAEYRAAWQEADREARSKVADDEEVFDLQVDPGVAEGAGARNMVYAYSHQVVKPGGQAIKRW